MTSAILSKLYEPATAVITAVAMHPKPDEFCKELALRGLNDKNILAVCILNHSNHAELQLVGGYGPKALLEKTNELVEEIEAATREKNIESLRIVEVKDEDLPVKSVALVPSAPMTLSSGVLAIFYESTINDEIYAVSTQIALAFACEMYCSSNWGGALNGSVRSKRATVAATTENRLTNRQKSVLEYMADGKTNDRIARLLNYSVATVKNDISAIFQFLGVSNRHDAIEVATSQSLLPPPPAISKQSTERLIKQIRKSVSDAPAKSAVTYNFFMTANKNLIASAYGVCMCMRMCR